MISDHVFLNTVMSANSLTDASKMSYMKHLRQVKKNIPHPLNASYYNMILHPKQVMNEVTRLIRENKVSLNTGKAHIVSLAMLIKRANENNLTTEAMQSVHKDWIDNVNKINGRVLSTIEDNKLSKREKDGWVDFNEWKDLEKKLRSSEEGSQSHLLVAFHALITPPRGGDLADVKIVSSNDPYTKKNKSFILWDGITKPSYIVIREHKTNKKWPSLKQELPQSLAKSLEVSLEQYPRQYLFESDGKPYKRGIFINWKNREFKRLFGKPVTTNIARHAFVNHQESKPRSIKDKRVEAEMMGHSLSTHNEYRKLN